jgi:hypothetical protein
VHRGSAWQLIVRLFLSLDQCAAEAYPHSFLYRSFQSEEDEMQYLDEGAIRSVLRWKDLISTLEQALP